MIKITPPKPRNIIKLSTVTASVLLLIVLIGSIGAVTNNAPTPAATEPTKTCFQCSGVGSASCPDSKCKKGQVICPGKCMKLSVGVWEHQNVAGHSPTELWQKFRYGPNGGGSVSWNQNHVGEVVEMRNGMPTNIGKCSVCGGKTVIKCPTCKGTSTVTCNICDGLKVVPDSWSAFDNPKMKNRPDRFLLKDGRVIVGRKIMASGDSWVIKTEKGNVEVPVKDLAGEKKP